MSVLRFGGVHKRFQAFTAVRDLSLDLEAGKICGFLGVNGAGKTTTLKMALGILQPTRGVIELFGAPPGRGSSAQVGFCPEERALYPSMTPLAIVEYFGRLKGMSRGAANESASQLLKRLDLERFRNARIDTISKGTAQRVQIACALVNRPRLLILDEPFSGLDPLAQASIELVLRERAQDGAAIIVSTHVLPHAERLCDRIMVLAKGRKVFDGDHRDIGQLLAPRLWLTTREDPRRLKVISAAEPSGQEPNGSVRWLVTLKDGLVANDLLRACFENRLEIGGFIEERPSLQDAFSHLVNGEEKVA